MIRSSTAAAQFDAGAECSRATLARVRYLLAADRATEHEVLRSLAQLTDAELMTFGLSAYQMNLLSLFGDAWSSEKIRRTAREAAINKLWLGWEYFHHYLPRLTPSSKPRLKRFPLRLISQLLERGRGLVVATFHQGHYRYIASDLAIAGIPTCVLLDRDSLRSFEGARKSCPPGTFAAAPRAAIAEDVRSCVDLSKTLAGGGCVHAMLDGNTGLDGPRGSSHRTEVEILGCIAQVKNGLIKLAAHHGSPILPVFAHTIGDEKTCHTGSLLDPGQRLSGADAAAFAEQAMRVLYRHFTENVLTFASEWSGCDHFHLWRKPDVSAHMSIQEVEQRLARDLAAGSRVTINEQRIIVELSRDNDLVWTDVKTMRCYKLPSEMLELVRRLSAGEEGVDADWLAKQEDAQRSRMWRFMLQLALREAICSHDSTASAA